MDQLTPQSETAKDESIDDLLARINGMVGGEVPPAERDVVDDLEAGAQQQAAEVDERADQDVNKFWPEEPQTLYDAKVSSSLVEELICKFLLAKGECKIRDIANQVCMPYGITEEIVTRLKQEQILGYIDSHMNDYVCKLTDVGREREKRYSEFCSYFGATPVHFDDYVDSVTAQTINNQSPSEEDLARAFSDLLIDPAMMTKLGPLMVNLGS